MDSVNNLIQSRILVHMINPENYIIIGWIQSTILFTLVYVWSSMIKKTPRSVICVDAVLYFGSTVNYQRRDKIKIVGVTLKNTSELGNFKESQCNCITWKNGGCPREVLHFVNKFFKQQKNVHMLWVTLNRTELIKT